MFFFVCTVFIIIIIIIMLSHEHRLRGQRIFWILDCSTAVPAALAVHLCPSKTRFVNCPLHVVQVSATGEFFKPVISAFVDQEGSWFFTGGDDEHGSSAWSANAQIAMASPLPPGKQYSFTTFNEMRLLSDEDKIPPYYRNKHRPVINVTGSTISTSTVCQPRYIEVSVGDTQAGTNAWEIIKEEKLHILTAIPDDGATEESSIELATKLASRQLVWNRTGAEADPSLDDGDRCANINKEAYKWAMATVSPAALKRFQAHGLPLSFGADVKPFPPAG